LVTTNAMAIAEALLRSSIEAFWFINGFFEKQYQMIDQFVRQLSLVSVVLHLVRGRLERRPSVLDTDGENQISIQSEPELECDLK